MVSILGRFTKQPGETLDYDVDFADWMSNREDAIASHTATADTGITVVTSALVGNVVKIVLSGGSNGSKYKVTARVTTNASPAIIKEADFIVTVKEV